MLKVKSYEDLDIRLVEASQYLVSLVLYIIINFSKLLILLLLLMKAVL